MKQEDKLIDALTTQKKYCLIKHNDPDLKEFLARMGITPLKKKGGNNEYTRTRKKTK